MAFGGQVLHAADRLFVSSAARERHAEVKASAKAGSLAKASGRAIPLNAVVMSEKPPFFTCPVERRRSRLPTACQIARHSFRSSVGNLSIALDSRNPARSGSACQCSNIFLTRTRPAWEPLSSILAQTARSARSHARACVRQCDRSVSLSLAPSSPSPQPARAAHRAAG